jgi:hypothetical protein
MTNTDTLLKHFGPVSDTRPAGLKDTELWSYSPWPFSFEIMDGHVTSIRITDPGPRGNSPVTVTAEP